MKMKSKSRCVSRHPFRSWQNRQEPHRGLALVLVLWIMVVLSTVALHLSFSSHLRARVTATVGEGTKALFLARGGVERAIADLVKSKNSAQGLSDLRDNGDDSYSEIELGEGSYTLFAGMGSRGQPQFGIIDEAAKINVGIVDVQILSKVPRMNANLAEAIVSLRTNLTIRGVGDLLQVKGVDSDLLFGEDHNGNAILDSNEDDGNASWPPDNSDGQLERGLVEYLTTWSASLNVTADGESRVNINKASADEIVKSVSGISSKEAEAIVEHRKKNEFATIGDLLDVELVTKTHAGANEGIKNKDQPTPESSEGSTENKEKASPSPNSEGETKTESTGKKAFSKEKFAQVAGFLTVNEEPVLQGRINLNTADYEVLACLPGVTEDIAREIVRTRESQANGFTTLATLLDIEGMSIDAFKQVCPHVSIRSDVFRVRSFGVLENGNVYRSVEAVIDRTGEAVTIRSWRELE